MIIDAGRRRSGKTMRLLKQAFEVVEASQDIPVLIISPTCSMMNFIKQTAKDMGYNLLVDGHKINGMGIEQVNWTASSFLQSYDDIICCSGVKCFVDEVTCCDEFARAELSDRAKKVLKDAYVTCLVEENMPAAQINAFTRLLRMSAAVEAAEPSSGKVKIYVKKLTPTARMPERAHDDDAGADVYADSKHLLYVDYDVISYGTGLAFAVPDGYWMDLRPRSSVYKTGLMLANGVGTIDAGYRGEVKAVFNTIWRNNPYNVGDKIAQLVVMPNVSPRNVEFVEVDELPSENDRGGGFGSTGK